MYFIYGNVYMSNGLPRWLNGRESACNAGDVGLIPGSGRSPGEGNGSLYQCSCLGKPENQERKGTGGTGGSGEMLVSKIVSDSLMRL